MSDSESISVPVSRAINVREETYQLISSEAKSRGVSRAQLVRMALLALLGTAEGRKPRKETRKCR